MFWAERAAGHDEHQRVQPALTRSATELSQQMFSTPEPPLTHHPGQWHLRGWHCQAVTDTAKLSLSHSSRRWHVQGVRCQHSEPPAPRSSGVLEQLGGHRGSALSCCSH